MVEGKWVSQLIRRKANLCTKLPLQLNSHITDPSLEHKCDHLHRSRFQNVLLQCSPVTVTWGWKCNTAELCGVTHTLCLLSAQGEDAALPIWSWSPWEWRSLATRCPGTSCEVFQQERHLHSVALHGSQRWCRASLPGPSWWVIALCQSPHQSLLGPYLKAAQWKN